MASDNLFDGLQATTFDVVTATMGYTATWQPSDGGPLQTARVLYRNPTENQKLADQLYDPYRYTMEYKQGHFAGLKERADGQYTEQVAIGSINYYVRKVEGKFDGKTMVATLEPIV